MSDLLESPHRTQLESLARQTGFSADAVSSMRDAMIAGGGRMAQFDHPEFGGSGQWMHGGMLMIGDFSDHALRARVAKLCDALSAWIANEPSLADAASQPSHQRQSQTSNGATRVQDSRNLDGRWWPASFGTPNTSGAQDGSRYAWFAGARRLVIDDGRTRTIYDTGEHRIGGASQQQGASLDRGPVFTSQFGFVALDRLPIVGSDVDADGHAHIHADADAGDASVQADAALATPDATPAMRGDAPSADDPAASRDDPAASRDDPAASRDDPFAALERLAGLHARGIVDDAEFAAKKAELLERI